MFYCEFYEISRKTFFIEHHWSTASAEKQMLKISYLNLMRQTVPFKNISADAKVDALNETLLKSKKNKKKSQLI